MTTAPRMQTADPGAALALFDDHPAAMLQADAQGRVTWMNAAARTGLGFESGRAPLMLDHLGIDASALDPAGACTFDATVQGAGGPPTFCRIAAGPPANGARLLTLTPLDDLKQAAARAQHLGELLDMVQDFGRLGVWERDIRTLQGRWDKHVYRFWGLDPNSETPGFGEATQAVVPEDRVALDIGFRASLRQAGTYSRRFRVRRPDGTIRQLHSQWAVKNGPDGAPSRVLGIMMDDTEAWALAHSHDEALAQLSAAVDLGRIAIWRHDLLTDRVAYSPIAYEVLGVEPRPDGLTLEEVRERIHPDDLPAVIASAERALATDQPVDLEARYRRSDGQWRTLLTRRVVQRDAEGRPIAFTGVGLDVTEPREESQRARDMARRFELATRTAGIGYWSLEHDAPRARWSDQLYALFGLPRTSDAPTLGEWLAAYVHPDDRAQVQQTFRDWVVSGRLALEAAFRIVRTDGAVCDVITHSRLEGSAAAPLLFGVVIDVTERRAAELALRQASERASLIAQGVGLGTWEHDLASGTDVWDEQMWRLRGREPRAGAMSPDDRLAITHPDDRETALHMFERALNTTLPVDYEFRVLWPDDSVHWLASRSVAVCDADGRPVRRIGVNWDITDAHSAVIAREEKAAAQREVQAKSQFLSRMSHELRTPLNAVLGFTQLLMADGERAGAASRQRRLAHIRSAGQHLLSLIDDVLDLSRLEGGEVTMEIVPAALRPLVEQVLPLVEPLMREHGVSVVTGEIDVVPMADPTRLRQVLLNLLTNAVKYNRSGGSVTLAAEASHGVALIRVVDSGRGMTPEQQRHLFEPFNRLGAEASGIEGTGIGLAIVKALVERMGGTVEVTSSAGVGSAFVLRLRDGAHAPPAPEESASPQALALAATAGRVGAGGTVLYVEDNPVNAMIVAELLARRSDLTLHIAVDGLSGLALAAQVKPQLVLLDMQLPDIDGHQVFERLQSNLATASIPCIALSANAMPADIDRALRMGFSDYWTKPLDFRAFMASIDALFGPAPE